MDGHYSPIIFLLGHVARYHEIGFEENVSFHNPTAGAISPHSGMIGVQRLPAARAIGLLGHIKIVIDRD